MTQVREHKRPIFRFAPSPNGRLHLGHALSALLNLKMAREAGGVMLLRIEDIDRVRCTPKLEAMMLADLEWIGFEWDEPPRRQSMHFAQYKAALDELQSRALVYPAFLSRAQIKALAAADPHWPADPDGAPHYPGDERSLSIAKQAALMAGGADFALRIDMGKAIAAAGKPLSWNETGAGPGGETGMVAANPQDWGDAILGRKDVPASYHLACVLDDALQGVTHVVRGADLFHATSIHRLLQELLALPAPVYHHHRLILGPDGTKLSKSRSDTAIAHLRDAGVTPEEVRRMIGL
ncbi:MAG TPA: tRNA glutamyl-Q(34) synthetase GluQRS [Rhizobiaceae bacterium]|nr:tRNA glutamyl-Q(34) synthetase GluQRS [Rhizobiaceae bacterium]